MDLRVLVLTGDLGLAELLRTQVENLGCNTTVRATYDEASSAIEWADAAIIDLAGDGLNDLNRLRVEAPRLRILAIAVGAAQEDEARTAGADQVLVEPFAIADLCASVRGLGPAGDGQVIDLRSGTAAEATQVEGSWFATS